VHTGGTRRSCFLGRPLAAIRLERVRGESEVMDECARKSTSSSAAAAAVWKSMRGFRELTSSSVVSKSMRGFRGLLGSRYV